MDEFLFYGHFKAMVQFIILIFKFFCFIIIKLKFNVKYSLIGYSILIMSYTYTNTYIKYIAYTQYTYVLYVTHQLPYNLSFVLKLKKYIIAVLHNDTFLQYPEVNTDFTRLFPNNLMFKHLSLSEIWNETGSRILKKYFLSRKVDDPTRTRTFYSITDLELHKR